MNGWLPAPDANDFGQRRLVVVDRLLLPFLLGVVDALTHPNVYTGDSEDIQQMVLEVERFYNALVKGGITLMLGDIVASAAVVPPEGHLLCDGSLYEAADYPELFAVLDPQFKVGTTGFRVPDLRSRAIIGAGQGSGLTNRTVGGIVGSETQALSVANMPAHTHPAAFTNPANSSGAVLNLGGVMTGGALGVPYLTTGTRLEALQQSSQGSGTAHNNMQPSYVLNFYMIASQ